MLKGTYSALMLGLALVGVGGAANAEPPAGAAGVAAEAQDLMNDNLDADPRWERISEGLWRKSGDGEKAYVAKGPQGRSAYRAIVALEIQGLEQRLKQKHDDSAAKELKGKYEDWRMLGEDGGVSSALSPICPAYCSSMGIQVGPVAGGGVFAHSYFSCNMPIAVGYARTYAKSDQTPAQELAHGGFSVANYGVYYAAPGTSGCVSSATFSINCPSFVYAVNRTTCF